VHYYSEPQNKYEVDFICNDPASNDVSLIQVCTDVRVAETKERELRALLSARKIFDKASARDMKIITMDYKTTETVSGLNVEYVPAWEWLLQSMN